MKPRKTILIWAIVAFASCLLAEAGADVGARGDECRDYRYDDDDRWSTTLPEQWRKSRHVVQNFAQIRDLATTGRAKSLAAYRRDPAVRRFERELEDWRLRLLLRYDASNVPNFATPRPFTLDMAQMVWTINGRVFEMMETAEDEMVWLDETMAWEWINNSPIPHPMHVHNVMFQVVGRTSPGTASYATINQGLVDTGWKDTVLVWPGERVKIAMTFGPHAGMYIYPCHILEHEDMTMMRNYMIMDPMMPEM